MEEGLYMTPQGQGQINTTWCDADGDGHLLDHYYLFVIYSIGKRQARGGQVLDSLCRVDLVEDSRWQT